MRSPFLHWLFYGHIWIALAALALSWQSTYLMTGRVALSAHHAFVFFATLAVYTLHRLLSYRRAGGEPTGRRYHLVAGYLRTSILVGVVSLGAALLLATSFSPGVFVPVLFALPFTFFYLIPLYPGGPRLRDLPYLKVIWVALAWTLMTDAFLVGADWLYWPETPVRFLFTLSVALLFDTRDVELDRRQGVRTLAADYPRLNSFLAIGALLGCTLVSFLIYPGGMGIALGGGYLAAAAIGGLTRVGRGEDFYASWVNGALLLPPLGLLLYQIISSPR